MLSEALNMVLPLGLGGLLREVQEQSHVGACFRAFVRKSRSLTEHHKAFEWQTLATSGAN